MKYIVEFYNGGNPYWLADWEGDPGRTLVYTNAKVFTSKERALQAKLNAIMDNPERYNGDTTLAKIVQVDETT